MDRLFGPMTPRHQRLTSMTLLEMFEQQSIQSFDYHDLSMQLKSIFRWELSVATYRWSMQQ